MKRRRATKAAKAENLIAPCHLADDRLKPLLACESRAARVLLSPFWAGTAHVVQLGPIWILLNAIFAATGRRLRSVPLMHEGIRTA
jgi:hypothetical protein